MDARAVLTLYIPIATMTTIRDTARLPGLVVSQPDLSTWRGIGPSAQASHVAGQLYFWALSLHRSHLCWYGQELHDVIHAALTCTYTHHPCISKARNSVARRGKPRWGVTWYCMVPQGTARPDGRELHGVVQHGEWGTCTHARICACMSACVRACRRVGVWADGRAAVRVYVRVNMAITTVW